MENVNNENVELRPNQLIIDNQIYAQARARADGSMLIEPIPANKEMREEWAKDPSKKPVTYYKRADGEMFRLFKPSEFSAMARDTGMASIRLEQEDGMGTSIAIVNTLVQPVYMITESGYKQVSNGDFVLYPGTCRVVSGMSGTGYPDPHTGGLSSLTAEVYDGDYVSEHYQCAAYG